VNEPAKCPNPSCQAKFSMQMVYNRSCFLDKQLMKMQENPNEIPEGETPHTVSMFARQVGGSAREGGDPAGRHAFVVRAVLPACCCSITISPPFVPTRLPLQDLVDLAKPGDRITVTGVYRAMGVRTNPRLRELKVGGCVGGWMAALTCACWAGWLAGWLLRTVLEQTWRPLGPTHTRTQASLSPIGTAAHLFSSPSPAPPAGCIQDVHRRGAHPKGRGLKPVHHVCRGGQPGADPDPGRGGPPQPGHHAAQLGRRAQHPGGGLAWVWQGGAVGYVSWLAGGQMCG
jgi:hypothetical protein